MESDRQKEQHTFLLYLPLTSRPNCAMEKVDRPALRRRWMVSPRSPLAAASCTKKAAAVAAVAAVASNHGKSLPYRNTRKAHEQELKARG
jgi:hypothetical protein